MNKIKLSYITKMSDFMDFIRKQGVVGLAVGFILGGAVSKLVTGLIEDIIDPLLGIVIGKAEGLTDLVWEVGGAELMLGNFISLLVDFIVVALVVYVGVKKLGLDKLDKKEGLDKEASVKK